MVPGAIPLGPSSPTHEGSQLQRSLFEKRPHSCLSVSLPTALIKVLVPIDAPVSLQAAPAGMAAPASLRASGGPAPQGAP